MRYTSVLNVDPVWVESGGKNVTSYSGTWSDPDSNGTKVPKGASDISVKIRGTRGPKFRYCGKCKAYKFRDHSHFKEQDAKNKMGRPASTL